jgi:hypothetical protein
MAFVTGLLICLSVACASFSFTATKATATKVGSTSTPAPTTVSAGAPGPAATATDTHRQRTAHRRGDRSGHAVADPTEDLGATATAFFTQTGTFGQVPSIPVTAAPSASPPMTSKWSTTLTPTRRRVKFYKDQMPQNG